MSDVGEAFIEAFGAPSPATANGIHFGGYRTFWEGLHDEIGSGWFMDGFLYLFGEGLEALEPCLDAWSFLVPKNDTHIILGKNAYGAIFVLENPTIAYSERVHVLDPCSLTYWSDPNCLFTNLIGRWLPKRDVPEDFLDDRPYNEWREANGVGRLAFDDVLGIKTPLGLGGELVPDNFQLQNIVEYYQTTGPIYAEAFAKLKSQ